MVQCERVTPALPVGDLPAAVAFYTTRLGFRPGFLWGEPPTFAGVDLGTTRLFFSLGAPKPGCAIYFTVDDADALYVYHCAQGVEVLEPIGDREYGIRDYEVRDLNGYTLGFGHVLHGQGARLEIERVDVPVRLEKRLAALIADLAAHKRMSLASLLEETLLHTLDGVEPHTPADLRAIEALKRQHGIDYDTHASYRFVERGDSEAG